MKNKIYFIYLCILSTILCMACGKKNKDIIPFQITSVIINQDTKSAKIAATYDDKNETKKYNIHDLSFIGADKNNDNKTVVWSGFYNDINDIIDDDLNVKVWKDIGETPKNVSFNGEVNYAEARTYKVKFKDIHITVMVTPFSVVVQPEKSWHKGNETIVLNAVLKDGNKKLLASLPIKLNSEISEDINESLEYIGDGFVSAQSLENDGVKYITNQQIDIDTIEKVEVTDE